jgi:predicted aspartyl protease
MKKYVSKAAAVALAAMMAFVGGPPAAFADIGGFGDIGGHWAEGQILAGVGRGFINGYQDGTFKPDNLITRAEFVKIINSANGYSEVVSIPFGDVPVTEWYYPEVQKAYKAGYIQGDNGAFRPTANISRQEVAVILERLTQQGDPNYPLTGVVDAASIASWAEVGVRKAFSMGYIQGDDKNMFNPANPLKRGEAVTIINRMLGVSPVATGGTGGSTGSGTTNPGTGTTNPSAVTPSLTTFNVTGVSSTSATLNLYANKEGRVYWVLLKGSSSSTPSADQIVNGRNASGSTADNYGDDSVYANSSKTRSLSSLDSDQSYRICGVLVDTSGARSGVQTTTFTTSGVGEAWLTTFSYSSQNSSGVRLTYKSTRDGYLYYVVLDSSNSSTAPRASDIRNYRDYSGKTPITYGRIYVSRNVEDSTDITDLSPSTSYRIYGCVYEDTSSSSAYSTVKNVSFSTTAASSADWLSSLTSPSDSNKTTTTARVYANLGSNVGTSGSYKLDWVVYNRSDGPTTSPTAPTAAQIRNHTWSTYSAYAVYGEVDVSSRTQAIELSGLAPGKNYRIYGVVYYNGTYSSVRTVDFTTKTDTGAADLVSLGLAYHTSGASYTTMALSPAFTPGVWSYSVTVPATDALRLTVKPASSTFADYSLDGAGSTFIASNNAEGSTEMNVSAGSHMLRVIVTQTGKPDKVYSIAITVQAPVAAKLASLSIRNASFSFSPSTFSYNVSVPTGASVLMNLSSEQPGDAVTVQCDSGSGFETVTEASGAYTLPLADSGSTTVKINVSRANVLGSDYTLTLTKSPSR